jgi:hypothetical protein
VSEVGTGVLEDWSTGGLKVQEFRFQNLRASPLVM